MFDQSWLSLVWLVHIISGLACLSQNTYSRPSMPFPSDTSFIQTSQRGSLDVSSHIFTASLELWDCAQHAATSTRPKAPLCCQHSQRLHARVPRSRHHLWFLEKWPELNESLISLVMVTLLAPEIASDQMECLILTSWRIRCRGHAEKTWHRKDRKVRVTNSMSTRTSTRITRVVAKPTAPPSSQGHQLQAHLLEMTSNLGQPAEICLNKEPKHWMAKTNVHHGNESIKSSRFMPSMIISRDSATTHHDFHPANDGCRQTQWCCTCCIDFSSGVPKACYNRPGCPMGKRCLDPFWHCWHHSHHRSAS